MAGCKKIYLGTNTKMYKTIADTKKYLSRLGELTRDISRDEVELFVIPSFTALESASPFASIGGIRLGAQNMCWEEQGQFTGEISPIMLREVGVDVVELGHSERRHVLGETDEMIQKKVTCGLRNGFTVLLCIGETEEDKNTNISVEVLRSQLKKALYEVSEQDALNLWVAYEPVWAIGVNGKPASAEYAGMMHSEIRRALSERFVENGTNIPLLYGGSVNRGNAVSFMEQKEIDGLFVGRAAWDAEEFNTLIRNVLEKRKKD